jgi:hypothetical protein
MGAAAGKAPKARASSTVSTTGAALAEAGTGVMGERPQACNPQYPALKPAASHNSPASAAGQGLRPADRTGAISPGKAE